jgi:hypothetical protein
MGGLDGRMLGGWVVGREVERGGAEPEPQLVGLLGLSEFSRAGRQSGGIGWFRVGCCSRPKPKMEVSDQANQFCARAGRTAILTKMPPLSLNQLLNSLRSPTLQPPCSNSARQQPCTRITPLRLQTISPRAGFLCNHEVLSILKGHRDARAKLLAAVPRGPGKEEEEERIQPQDLHTVTFEVSRASLCSSPALDETGLRQCEGWGWLAKARTPFAGGAQLDTAFAGQKGPRAASFGLIGQSVGIRLLC